MHLIVDAHEDLAWNALTFGRDYTRSALETRRAEAKSETPARNGHTLLGLPEYLQGQVAVVFSTLFVSPARSAFGWEAESYSNGDEAYRAASRQMDYYHRLADEHQEFRLIGRQADLEEVLATWATGADPALRRVGLVPLMEGADPIREPQEAELWMERGVRIVGLAWASTIYSGGTGEPGPLTPEGRRLLDVMSDLGLILDLSHASDESFMEALDRFQGTVIVSHANPRALLKNFARPERMLSDDMIGRVAEAGGVIGVVPFNRFLNPVWRPAEGKEAVPLSLVLDMIDHICQVTGSAAHVGLGSDFDGGFGVGHTPAEIDTVADLQKLDGLLKARGYSDQDVAGILGQNWIEVLRRGLPA